MVEGIVKAKLEHDFAISSKKTRIGSRSKPFNNLLATMEQNNELTWKKYVGLD
jgi:hypothetical protein